MPGLPEEAESTTEVSADGAKLLKVAVDGTRSQVAALLTELSTDALLFDFATHACMSGAVRDCILVGLQASD